MDDDALKYLNHWGYIIGTPEADAAWKAKQEFDAGKRVLEVPLFFGVKDVCYDSPIDGRPITSMAARREDMARSGCIEYDPEMRTDTMRRQRESEENLEKSVDSLLDREIALLPTSKKESLAAELSSGVTAEPVRQTLGA